MINEEKSSLSNGGEGEANHRVSERVEKQRGGLWNRRKLT